MSSPAPQPGPALSADEAFQAALAHHQRGALQQAQALYQRILATDPNHANALHLLGVLAYQSGQSEAAIGLIGRSLAVEPGFAEAHGNLGHALFSLGKTTEAIAAYERAIALKPDFLDAHAALANVLRTIGKPDDAEAACARALAQRADHAPTWIQKGRVQLSKGQFELARDSFAEASRLDPGSHEALLQWGAAARGLGHAAEAIDAFRRASALRPDLDDAASSLLFAIYADQQLSPQACLDEARAFGARVAAKAQGRFTSWNVDPRPQRLRVGFVSGDFHRHPVAYFLESLLEHLDRAHVEVHAFHAYNRWDDTTERLRARADGWTLISRMNDAGAARAIRDAGIHVLIDLSGHTTRNRLPALAWKPAPVQATWLGYFATTGVQEIDYLIADPHVVPPGEEDHFTETVWRLPESYLCFSPPAIDIEVGPLPALANGFVTFGCFNNLSKLNDAVVANWSGILAAIPRSRLFLKSKQLQSTATADQTRARFAAHGIEPARLILEGGAPRDALLAAYHRVDIALDPFPYPGGTTSAEAVWMGVPVITRAGDRFLSRVGESVAHNAGLKDWIARDRDDAIAIAVRRAADLPALAASRGQLRAQVLAAPLFDAPRFAANFSAAVWAMWERHRASLPTGDTAPA